MVARSGDATEQAQTLTDPGERYSRDQSVRAVLDGSAAKHHEVVAETELNVDCCGSSIVVGDTNSYLGPGHRFPDTIAVQPWDSGRRPLHELTHRAGHTLVLLGGPTTRGPELAPLLAALQHLATGSVLFEAAFAFTRAPTWPTISGAWNPPQLIPRCPGHHPFRCAPDGYIGLDPSETILRRSNGTAH